MPAPIGAEAVPHTITVATHGRFAESDRESARAAIAGVLLDQHQTDGARVRLTGANCADGPAVIQVNLRVCGAPARIQVPGASASQAIATGAARLRRQIQRLSTTWEAWPWPDPERRSLSLPSMGTISRVKEYRLYTGTPCQATAVLNALDYDVFLFVDTDTGEDSVVYRAGPTGVRLARHHTMRPPTTPGAVSLTVNSRHMPRLTPEEAAQRVAEAWLPYLFFIDPGSDRGNLLYRRYDGNFGLIVPAPRMRRMP